MKIHLLLAIMTLGTALAAADKEKKSKAPAGDDKPSPLGYTDTPVIPGTTWHVHDPNRPAPKVVRPGQTAANAPSDAVVIFDGKNVNGLVGKAGAPCPWKIENGELVVSGGDVWTKGEFASCQVHLEWKGWPEQKGNSQKRGNAGVFLMDRYESQILDCFDNPTYADGMVGAVYGQTPALANPSRKPGDWQVCDIIFTAPKLENGKVVEPAFITSIVNGVCTQNHTKIMGPTKHKQITNYEGEFPAKAPIRLQDHKNDPPLRLRNVWVRPLP